MVKAKQKSIFTCQSCGYQSLKWLGRCPDCGSWNSFNEELTGTSAVSKSGPEVSRANYPKVGPRSISDIDSVTEERFSAVMPELDRVLGGGIVEGSCVLIGGDPGIGKSTLLLQASEAISRSRRVLYVCGEESVKQTKMRAERLGSVSRNLYIVNETNIDSILEYVARLKPGLLIVDSIQVLFKEGLSSAPGSVSQVKFCGQELTFAAKRSGMPVFLIGHVTKEGSIAGPKVLEHMVDTVLYFEGDRHMSFRLLRSVKNRFGSTNEIGIFEMTGRGLKEVSNPSGIFIEERPKGVSGFSVVPTLEGTRPLLVEVQALVSPTSSYIPKRESRGLDYNRISLIAAVLERRMGLEFGRFDIYVNAAGGVNVSEPAIDLGIAFSVYSNHRNIPLDPDCVVMGEVGLGAEIRSVSQIEPRVREASRLGFKKAVIPKGNMAGFLAAIDIEIIPVSFLAEAFEATFKKG